MRSPATDVSPAEIQQLLLKHMAESARKDSLLPALSLPSSIGADKSVASKSRDRVEDNRESINGDCGDNDRRYLAEFVGQPEMLLSD